MHTALLHEEIKLVNAVKTEELMARRAIMLDAIMLGHQNYYVEYI